MSSRALGTYESKHSARLAKNDFETKHFRFSAALQSMIRTKYLQVMIKPLSVSTSSSLKCQYCIKWQTGVPGYLVATRKNFAKSSVRFFADKSETPTRQDLSEKVMCATSPAREKTGTSPINLYGTGSTPLEAWYKSVRAVRRNIKMSA